MGRERVIFQIIPRVVQRDRQKPDVAWLLDCEGSRCVRVRGRDDCKQKDDFETQYNYTS